MRIAVASSNWSASSETVDVVGPELGVVVERGERVLHADRVRVVPESALEDGSALSFCPLSSIASPTICARFCGGGLTQLHLAELGDHLEATDLAVHLARSRSALRLSG